MDQFKFLLVWLPNLLIMNVGIGIFRFKLLFVWILNLLIVNVGIGIFSKSHGFHAFVHDAKLSGFLTDLL